MKLNTFQENFGIPLTEALKIAQRKKKKNVSVDDDIRQVLEICKGDYKVALRMVAWSWSQTPFTRRKSLD
jgi:hypothetical protein